MDQQVNKKPMSPVGMNQSIAIHPFWLYRGGSVTINISTPFSFNTIKYDFFKGVDLGAKLVHPDLNNDALGCNQFLISINFITDDIQENHAKNYSKKAIFLHAPKKVTNGANNSEMITSSPYVYHYSPT